jgi:hypothetical protein
MRYSTVYPASYTFFFADQMHAASLPLVLAPDEQHHVEEGPEEESPGDGDEQAVPLADVRDALIRQHVGAGDDAGVGRELVPERGADGVEHFELHRLREAGDRGAVEQLHAAREAARLVPKLVLQHRLIGIFHQRKVVEPDPVVRDAFPGDEEPGEEEEVGEDGHDHRVPHHDLRHDGREERHEPASGPERGQHGQQEEQERVATAGESHGPEGGAREGQGQHDERRERHDGVREHVRYLPVGVVLPS